ncbi:MAG: general secretion pathway protein D [Cyanobacteria bacterium]|nr:general secretion pathway protein D [Cyanobacteriota bacterium]
MVKASVVRSCWLNRLLAVATFAALETVLLPAVAQPTSPYGPAGLPARTGSPALAPLTIPVGGSIELKLRRLSDAVELVLEGVGTAPQLQQTTRGSSWEALLLTAAPNGLRRGPQRFSLPEVGFQAVSLDGSGSTYRLQVTPVPGYPVGRPVVSADGRDLILSFAAPNQASLQTARPDLNQPGRVPQSSFVPPLQARAMAPPVGDMAVGTMLLTNPSFVNVSGPPVTMTLRNAPVKDVLMRLSDLGGYGFVYVEDCKNPGSTRPGGIDCDVKELVGSTSSRKVTIAFRNESFSRAFNTALLSAGLQGRRDGNMIVVGPNVLDKGFGSTMSKVYRLNQVSATSAADYLANLGATVTKTNTITTAVTEGTSVNNAVAGAPNAATTQASTSTTVEAYGSGVGPLRGLIGTTDTRLATITLVGPPQVVAIAEQYLKQLDLRQRQVALSVKILDVSLQNDSSIANSFAFRYGNNFIVNDQGNLAGAWGQYLPPSTRLGLDTLVGPIANPGLQYPKDQFFDVLKATIQSQSTKLLASPTLILTDNPGEISGGGEVTTTSSTSAGGAAESVFSSATIGRKRSNESFVTVGTQVITDYTVTTGTQGNGNACEPQFSTSGLTFGARVNKIDDNGFVTFNLSPSVSAVTDQQDVQGCGPINILSIRRLDTGSVRVRDGQTLILTGVISDFNSQGVNKWPILGDMPLIGQFFRSTSGTRTKNELVILVTPHIIDDNEGGTFGYGYQPSSSDARRLLGGSNP